MWCILRVHQWSLRSKYVSHTILKAYYVQVKDTYLKIQNMYLFVIQHQEQGKVQFTTFIFESVASEILSISQFQYPFGLKWVINFLTGVLKCMGKYIAKNTTFTLTLQM